MIFHPNTKTHIVMLVTLTETAYIIGTKTESLSDWVKYSSVFTLSFKTMVTYETRLTGTIIWILSDPLIYL